jgi:general stress protein 26
LARDKIERQAQVLRQQLTSYQLAIERGRHQFIVGQGGNAVHDLIAETGCSVVVPPADEDSETVYIIGPPDKIENAVNKIMDIAASMAVSNVDIARQHAKAPPAHAHNLTRYLQERQAIAALEQQYSANIVLPTSADGPATWQIFSQDGKQGMLARADAMNIIAAHPPSRLHPMQLDPYFHPHLQSRAAQQVRKNHGVHILFPDSSTEESSNLVLVYEAPGSATGYQLPRQAPSPAEVKEHERAIQEAKKYLMSVVGDDAHIVSRPIDAPKKYVQMSLWFDTLLNQLLGITRKSSASSTVNSEAYPRNVFLCRFSSDRARPLATSITDSVSVASRMKQTNSAQRFLHSLSKRKGMKLKEASHCHLTSLRNLPAISLASGVKVSRKWRKNMTLKSIIRTVKSSSRDQRQSARRANPTFCR